ncbi:hypothetical protein FB446DRAFT_239987 [Lentinula raphanica]|nr:hypothetical protein FB446DRAFT_239987 [Lentinula raphanica]
MQIVIGNTSNGSLQSLEQNSNSSIHELPVEILIRILSDVLADPMSAPFDCAQLWILGHICSRWRSIVCSEMPLAWSNINVDFRPFTRTARRPHHAAEILRVCIERTKDCPLRIAFRCASDIVAATGDGWLQCLDALVAVSERWKGVDLSIPITVLGRLVSAKGHLNSLEVLNLSLEPPNAHSLPHLLDVFEDAPKLSSVTTSSHLSSNTFKLPWKQIVNYRTQRMEVENCIDVLHLAPNLRVFHAKVEKPRSSSLGDRDTTGTVYTLSTHRTRSTFNSLQSLSLNVLMRPGYEHELLQRLLQLPPDPNQPHENSQILFPSLTDIRLATSPTALANYAALPLSQSCFGSSLTKVTIRSVFDAPSDYKGTREFLLALPMVRQLAFGVCFHHTHDVVNILYEILSLPSSSHTADIDKPAEIVLPKLEVLILDIDYGESTPTWVIDPMKEMIQSRRESEFMTRFGCVPLQKFHLYLATWTTPRQSFEKSLEELTNEDFEIKIMRGLL